MSNSFGLNPQELAELEKMMGGDVVPPSTAPQTDTAPPESLTEALQAQGKAEVAEAASASSPEPTQPEEAPQAPESDDQPGAPIRPVPYKRFAEVNSERATLKAERDELKAQLEAMRSLQEAKKAEAAPSQKEGRSWLESVLNGEDEPEPASKPDEIPEWGKQALSVLEEIRQERSMMALDRVVAGMQESYPDLPEEIILAGIAQGNSPEEIVQAWDHVGRAYVKAHGYTPAQAAAAQAQAQQQQQQRQADVAPRLSPSKGAMNAPEPPSWVKGWGKEHQNSVAAFIKTLG